MLITGVYMIGNANINEAIDPTPSIYLLGLGVFLGRCETVVPFP